MNTVNIVPVQHEHFKPCQRLSLSGIPISYPIMKLFTVTSEPAYLWDVPDRCQHSTAFQSSVAPVVERAAAVKFLKKHTFTKMTLIRLNVRNVVFV